MIPSSSKSRENDGRPALHSTRSRAAANSDEDSSPSSSHRSPMLVVRRSNTSLLGEDGQRIVDIIQKALDILNDPDGNVVSWGQEGGASESGFSR